EAEATAELDRVRTPDPVLPSAGSDPHGPLVVPPAVDRVRRGKGAGLCDRIRERECVSHALRLAEQADQRAQVPPGRGEETPVPTARTTTDDVLLHERDPERRIALGEPD